MRGMLRGLIVLGTLAFAAPAGASTLQGQYSPFAGSCCESRALLTYEAAPGERNDLTVSRSLGLRYPLPGSVGFGDLGAAITSFPPPIVDTAATVGLQPIGLLCLPLGVQVSCLTHASRVIVNVALGDGHDRADGTHVDQPDVDCGFGECFAAYWDGGGGEDNIAGTVAVDEMDGGDDSDVLYPRNGRDIVAGGNGDDYVQLEVDGAVDRVSCGTGIDTVARSAVDPLDVIDADCEIVGP